MEYFEKKLRNKVQIIINKIIEILSKIYFILIIILNSVWLIPFVVFIPLIKNNTLIRIGHIRADRVGHFFIESAENILLD